MLLTLWMSCNIPNGETLCHKPKKSENPYSKATIDYSQNRTCSHRRQDKLLIVSTYDVVSAVSVFTIDKVSLNL